MDNEEELNDDGLKELYDLLKKVPKIPLEKDNEKYLEVMKTSVAILKMIRVDYPDAEIKFEFDGLTGSSLLVEITAPGINIYDTKRFSELISKTSSICIDPVVDDKIAIGFVFEGIRHPIKSSI